MRKIILLLSILAICSAQGLAQKSLSNVCTDAERVPGPCIFLYKPVCAVQTNKEGKTIRVDFSNRCFACKDAATTLVIDGTCDSLPKGTTYCKAQKLTRVYCPDVWQPVCGYYRPHIQCFRAPCAVTLSNGCQACSNPDIAYYTQGACEGDDELLK